MKLHTGNIYRHGNMKDFLDTTIWTGEKLFAPTWEMVHDHKAGRISDSVYTARYLAILRTTYREHPEAFRELLSRPHVILGCYCKAGKFCHRHILKDVLIKIAVNWNIEVEDGGEL